MATTLKLIDDIIGKIDGEETKNDSETSFDGKFDRIIEKNTERVGLFIEYKIGTLSNSDYSCFGAACINGFDKMDNYLKTNNLSSYFSPYGLDITPDPPSETKNARFFVGFFVDDKYKNDKEEMDKIKKYETTEIKLKTLKPNKWWVYRFMVLMIICLKDGKLQLNNSMKQDLNILVMTVILNNI